MSNDSLKVSIGERLLGPAVNRALRHQGTRAERRAAKKIEAVARALAAPPPPVPIPYCHTCGGLGCQTCLDTGLAGGPAANSY